jgi:SAM-dependent methyltransferase
MSGSSSSIADRIHRAAHRRLVFDRRRKRLVEALSEALGPAVSILDIGCGSGEIGADLATGGRTVIGTDVLVRDSCEIPMARFDGRRLPFPDDAVDASIVVDVLHHSADPVAVLSEAARVSRRAVVVKDHYAESRRARWTLGAMDWVGNRQFGVGRDGAYLSRRQWAEVFERCDLVPERTSERLDLYPRPVKPVFEHGLHFVARLRPGS